MKRIYFNAGSAMRLTCEQLERWNNTGHDGKFHRSWWYWRPRFHFHGNPFRYEMVDFGASWLCYFFFVDIYFWKRHALQEASKCSQEARPQ